MEIYSNNNYVELDGIAEDQLDDNLFENLRSREYRDKYKECEISVVKNKTPKVIRFVEQVEYKKDAQVFKVQIKISTLSPKIQRYIQRNYKRYPIYDTKPSVSKRNVSGTIEAKGETLENLQNNNDTDISECAIEIARIIHHFYPEFTPSWYFKNIANQEYKKKRTDAYNMAEDEKKNNFKNRKFIRYKIRGDKEKLSALLRNKNKVNKIIKRLEKKLEKAENPTFATIKKILSLGIYHYLVSSRRVEKLKSKLQEYTQLQNKIISIEEAIRKELETDMADYKNSVNQYKEIFNSYQEKELQYSQERDEKANNAKILPSKISDFGSEYFIPLKTYLSLSNERVCGIYIIKNNKNNRCYVGQSKNVRKRILSDHFEKLFPKNPHLTTDYFNTPESEREDLFSVRIIPCPSQELDQKEAYYIDKYDAYESGYNETRGNYNSF